MTYWYDFAYYVGWRDDRRLQFQLRDGHAALFLARVLATLGYHFGGVIFNPPGKPPPPADPFARRQVDRSFLRPSDLIVLTTRPPLDDLLDGDRRYIRRSFTDLEEDVFRALRTLFEHCSRSQVTLTDAVVRNAPEIAERQSSSFYQNWGAAFESWGARNRSERKRPEKGKYVTAVYLSYVRHAWENGPALLAAFGVGGMETLGWCHLLATRFNGLVCSVPFAMAEIEAPPPPERPHTMEFVNSWDVRLLTPRGFETAA